MQLIATVSTQPEPDIPPATLAPILTRAGQQHRWQLNRETLATQPLPRIRQHYASYTQWRRQLERTWQLADLHTCRQLSTTVPASLYLVKKLQWEHVTVEHEQLSILGIQLHQQLDRLDQAPARTAAIDRHTGTILRIDTPGTPLPPLAGLTLTVGDGELTLTGPEGTPHTPIHSWQTGQPHPSFQPEPTNLPARPADLAAHLQLHTPTATDVQLETIPATHAARMVSRNLSAAAAHAQLSHRPLTITAAPLP